MCILDKQTTISKFGEAMLRIANTEITKNGHIYNIKLKYKNKILLIQYSYIGITIFYNDVELLCIVNDDIISKDSTKWEKYVPVKLIDYIWSLYYTEEIAYLTTKTKIENLKKAKELSQINQLKDVICEWIN